MRAYNHADAPNHDGQIREFFVDEGYNIVCIVNTVRVRKTHEGSPVNIDLLNKMVRDRLQRFFPSFYLFSGYEATEVIHVKHRLYLKYIGYECRGLAESSAPCEIAYFIRGEPMLNIRL